MRSDSTKANKWTGPDEINGVLHVGKGYRPAGMNMADRVRTDREQWYPGDSESGENGIWGDARPGSFDPSKVYRVPVERKDEPGIHGDAREGVDAPPVGRFENGKMSVRAALEAISEAMERDSHFAWTWHCNVAMAAIDAGAPPHKANERAADFMRNAFGVDVRDSEQWKADSLKMDIAPPVGEFEDGGRPGGPDCQTGEFDDDPEYLTAADFLRDDAVDHPNHYNDGSIECIDAIQAALTEEEFIGFCKGNAMKYIWREQLKNGMEDLQKAAWYLNRATEGLEAAE